MVYPNLFKDRYDNLHGKDWVHVLAPEDLSAFVYIGQREAQFGKLGGVARAAGAVRDERGRFARQDGTNKRTGEDPRKGTREDRELWKD